MKNIALSFSIFSLFFTGSLISEAKFVQNINLLDDTKTGNSSCLVLDDQNLESYNALGSGTSSDPYRIYNHQQLRSMANNSHSFDKYFIQCKDIDFLNTYDSNNPYFTIGSNLRHFIGNYNGNNFSISNFEYNEHGPYFIDPINGIYDVNGLLIRNDRGYVGLFGFIHQGSVSNLLILSPEIITETHHVGALSGGVWVANLNNIKLQNISFEKVFVVQGDFAVGGLVGSVSGNSYITNVSIPNNPSPDKSFVLGNSNVGGLFGVVSGNNVIINNSFVKNVDIRDGKNVINNGGTNFGGFVGYVTGDVLIERCYVENVRVGGTLAAYSGGFAGLVYSPGVLISKSHSSGEVSGFFVVGGFVGHLFGGNINDSFSTASVSSTFNFGGFVGRITPNGSITINRSYSSGRVVGKSFVGGFVGSVLKFSNQFDGEIFINNSYSTSNILTNLQTLVSITDPVVFGGFLGVIHSDCVVTINNSYSSGDVRANPQSHLFNINSLYAGGFVGWVDSRHISLVNNFTTSNVFGFASSGGEGGSQKVKSLTSPVFLYGKFVGNVSARFSSMFDNSYYYEYSFCPIGCNTFGVSKSDLSVFNGSGTSLSPFNWVFDLNNWSAIADGLPVLRNAGAF